MAKGKKVCSNCGTETGPRAHNCKECGQGFVVQGVLQPNISMKHTPKKIVNEMEYTKIQELFYLVEDPAGRAAYGPNSQTWESECGRYRIRHCEELMGVSLGEDKCYRVLIRDGDSNWWDILPNDEGRMANLQSAMDLVWELKNATAVRI